MLTNMDKPRGHCAKQKRTNTIRFHSYEVPTAVKITETESRKLVTKDWGKEKRELGFNGNRVSILRDKKALETYCTTMCIHLTLLNCILKDY